MEPSVISALIALGGSGIGTFAGIITSGKLTDYRLRELEKKVEKHNDLVDRIYLLEDRMNLYDEKNKVVNHRISDLEARQNEV